MTASIDPAGIAEHQRWLRSAGAEGAGLDLSSLVQPQAQLAGAELADAVLVRADLRGADLRGADLARAVLSGANLSGAVLHAADLTEADLDRTIVDGSTWSETAVTDAAGTVALTSATLLDGATRQTVDAAHLVEYLAAAGARIPLFFLGGPARKPPSPGAGVLDLMSRDRGGASSLRSFALRSIEHHKRTNSLVRRPGSW